MAGIAFILSLIFVLPLAWLRGFVLCKLWLWFVVPQFGLAPLTMLAAVGISLLVSLLTYQNIESESDKGAVERVLYLAGHSAFMSLFFWLFGWIYLGVFT